MIPSRFLPRQLSESTTDYSSCENTGGELQPLSARASADLLVAKYAYEAILKQKQQAAPISATTSSAAADSDPFAPSCATGSGLPLMPLLMPQLYPSNTSAPTAIPQPQQPVPLAGHRAASLEDMREAAETLTAFTANSLAPSTAQSPVCKEAYSDPWPLDDELMNLTGDEEQTVPEFTVGAACSPARGKPATTPRKKAAAAAGATGSPARTPGRARKVAASPLGKHTPTHVSVFWRSGMLCRILHYHY